METHPKHPDVAAIFARLLSELSVSANQLAAQLGTSQQAISNYVTGRNKPGGDLLAAIVTRYPAINSTWLLTGVGEPFPNGRTLTPAPRPVAVPTPGLTSGAATVAEAENVLLREQIVEQREMIHWLKLELGKSPGSADPATGYFPTPMPPRRAAGFQLANAEVAQQMLAASFGGQRIGSAK